MTNIMEFIEYVAKALVDNPEEVKVNEVAGERLVMYELKVNERDLGKIIGRQGQTARSLRTLVQAVGAKQGKRVQVEILE
jgi:hypothetical protein